MRVAVVGAGVSGLAAAHELARSGGGGGGVRVTVYEKEDCLGGHARTVAVEDAAAGTVHLDLGFMVFNRVRAVHSPATPNRIKNLPGRWP
jgi:cyclopropane-fatty-acyl-phospholipid synthase